MNILARMISHTTHRQIDMHRDRDNKNKIWSKLTLFEYVIEDNYGILVLCGHWNKIFEWKKFAWHEFYESLSVQNWEEQKLEKCLKENSETKRKDRPDNKHFNANDKSHTDK